MNLSTRRRTVAHRNDEALPIMLDTATTAAYGKVKAAAQRGEQSPTKRIERMQNGIPLPQPLLERLNRLAMEVGISQLA